MKRPQHLSSLVRLGRSYRDLYIGHLGLRVFVVGVIMLLWPLKFGEMAILSPEDFWFVFDFLLAFFMVLETWVIAVAARQKRGQAARPSEASIGFELRF